MLIIKHMYTIWIFHELYTTFLVFSYYCNYIISTKHPWCKKSSGKNFTYCFKSVQRRKIIMKKIEQFSETQISQKLLSQFPSNLVCQVVYIESILYSWPLTHDHVSWCKVVKCFSLIKWRDLHASLLILCDGYGASY